MNQLLNHITKNLYQLALRLCGYDVQDANDLVQNTCVRVIVKFDKHFKGKDLIDQVRIARVVMKNIFFDGIRRSKRVVSMNVDALEDSGDRTQYLKDLEHDLSVLERVMFNSDNPSLEALGLFYRGLSCKQIAQIQHTNVNTVTGRLRYARQNIRKMNLPLKTVNSN